MNKVIVLPVAMLMVITMAGCKKTESTEKMEAQDPVAVIDQEQDQAQEQEGGFNRPDNMPEIEPAVEENLLVTDMQGQGMENDPMADDEINMDTKEQVLSQAPVVVLVDVAGGTASGESRTVMQDDVTYHSVRATNMPELTNGDFYEGWLVKNAALGQFFSTGAMTQDENGDFNLSYVHDGDVTDHTKVVITLEPDDGDPAPAAHIIEN